MFYMVVYVKTQRKQIYIRSYAVLLERIYIHINICQYEKYISLRNTYLHSMCTLDKAINEMLLYIYKDITYIYTKENN